MRPMRPTVGIGVALALAMAACTGPVPSVTPVASHAHDPQADRVMAELGAQQGMAFEPAGPHHLLGTAPDGAQLDLVGVPVEQVVLSIPSGDPGRLAEAATPFLPHLRDLVQGPTPLWEWVAQGLLCRQVPERAAACQASRSQGNVTATFSDGGPDFVVLSVTRAR